MSEAASSVAISLGLNSRGTSEHMQRTPTVLVCPLSERKTADSMFGIAFATRGSFAPSLMKTIFPFEMIESLTPSGK